MNKTVLIFEDNISFAESLQFLINETDEMLCPKTYSDPSFIIQAIETYKPDVILMDIDMPNMNGIEAVKKVRSNGFDTPIIMQTIFDQDDKIYQSILGGANGYILKKSTPEKYISALSDVLAGGAPMTSSIANKVLKLMQKPPKEKANVDLSKREIETLQGLVDGLSYKMIGAKYGISRHTVNSHIRKVYEKLHVNNAAEAVSKALKDNIVSITALLALYSDEPIILDIFTRCFGS